MSKDTEDKMVCSKCGSCRDKLQDMGHGKYKGVVICYGCNAMWWDKWFTKEEWENMLEEDWEREWGKKSKELG